LGAGENVGSRLRRRLLVAGGVVVALLLALAGASALLAGSHRAPPPLGLNSPAAGDASLSGVDGPWAVATSQVGYRVKEQFINQPGPTEAVARTSKVTGGLLIVGSGASLKATRIHVSVDLASLQSQDTYASYQTYQRDFFIRSIYLKTDRYPNAEFDADSAAIPVGAESGPTALVASGRLTVHGVTKPVTAHLQVQLGGSNVMVAGSITVDMRDFGIEVPAISFTTAEPTVVIEFQLALVHS